MVTDVLSFSSSILTGVITWPILVGDQTWCKYQNVCSRWGISPYHSAMFGLVVHPWKLRWNLNNHQKMKNPQNHLNHPPPWRWVPAVNFPGCVSTMSDPWYFCPCHMMSRGKDLEPRVHYSISRSGWTEQRPVTPPKTNMTMENPPFEDVFPIETGDFPMSC